MVQDAPGDIGNVPVSKVEHAIELAAAQAGEKTTPKPGDPKYDETKETAVNSVLEGIWIQGLANQWGIEVTEKEVEAEVKKVKKESFKSEAEFQKFLKESHFTPADVHEKVLIQMLSKELQEQLKEKAPTPSHERSQGLLRSGEGHPVHDETEPRHPHDPDQKSQDKPKKRPMRWPKTTRRRTGKKSPRSTRKTRPRKNSGGLQKAVQEGTLEEPLNAEVFGTPEGELKGPTKGKGGYVVYEVVNSTPESVQELKTVESQIQSTLAQRDEQEYFANFVTSFQTEWKQRSFCASEFTTERCANYKGNGHAKTAPAACYEASPKGGLPEACPAPVSQLVPALPGTVTPLEPKGKPLAQRPIPKAESGKEEEAAAGGLPEGAVPAPTEEAPPAETGE